MRIAITATCFFGAILAAAAPGYAADDKKDGLGTPPAIFTDVVSCKSIADPAARLSCYDQKVAALETARLANEVVIADRAQVQEARRGLFGLSLPNLKLFGNDDDADFQQIESVIKSVRSQRDGKYVFTLEDGAVWRQTETTPTLRTPKSGDPIEIKRGALGSFLAKIKGGKGFKVLRTAN
ncbi:MAG: hypothetical protein U5J78_06930 [Parasphingorhabdus sp.]|nr:hypothetical protein [Parasphingorhabdus sp.]